MHDEDGLVRSPDAVRASLKVLGGFTGDPTVDVHFGEMLDTVLIPSEIEDRRLRRHVFLARFARQNLLQWDDVESRVVQRYVAMLARFLKEESDAVKRAGSAEA